LKIFLLFFTIRNRVLFTKILKDDKKEGKFPWILIFIYSNGGDFIQKPTIFKNSQNFFPSSTDNLEINNDDQIESNSATSKETSTSNDNRLSNELKSDKN